MPENSAQAYPDNNLETAALSLPAYRPEVRVFPNPTRDQVTVELTDAAGDVFLLHWYDIYGREPAAEMINGSESAQFQFDRSPFADGMYILQITNQNNRVNQTLKVQKFQ